MTSPKFKYEDFCLCPACRADLKPDRDLYTCLACGKDYPLTDGVLRLMPEYEEDQRLRYQTNYEDLAQNFLKVNKYESDNVAYRHKTLLDFIGRNQSGRKVLDIGSSHGLYLSEIEADFKVAFDLADTYLRAVSPDSGITPIQGDAEQLPFKPGFFDLIIIADILEHLLNPEKLIQILSVICTPQSKVIVHIPWEENLEPYLNTNYEFTHLRSFTSFSFGFLWSNFEARRMKQSFPDLRVPYLFRLEGKIPRPLYNALTRRYFFSPGLLQRDMDWRMKRWKDLPRGEWWLKFFFKPIFRMYEMRLRNFSR